MVRRRTWTELFICHRDCSGFPFLHRDICHTHAYSMQIEGVKEFLVFPPTDAEFLYPFSAGSAGFSRNRSRIPDAFCVDLAVFPDFAKATPTRVCIHPGEILFVPADWWHTARCVSDAPSVTVGGNFVDETVFEKFSDAFADYQAMRSLAAVGASTL